MAKYDYASLPPAEKLRALESALRWTAPGSELSFYDTDDFLEELESKGWDWLAEEASEGALVKRAAVTTLPKRGDRVRVTEAHVMANIIAGSEVILTEDAKPSLFVGACEFNCRFPGHCNEHQSGPVKVEILERAGEAENRDTRKGAREVTIELTDQERRDVIAVLRAAREKADDQRGTPRLETAYRVLDEAIMRAMAMLNREEYPMREPHVVSVPRRG